MQGKIALEEVEGGKDSIWAHNTCNKKNGSYSKEIIRISRCESLGNGRPKDEQFLSAPINKIVRAN